ncbi:hypothetical protein SAMN05428944_2789 [Streptomyces sp. 1222.5]|uniref:hypothetical protein n=1 Tax=unclassified Streptomyces TaxID=2593676 RepID=UPI00089B25AA|nr:MULTISPECIES: hypothetical protein [unclassified Streptomyces]PKW10040.1 hypothetical protein BX260_5302 [Streptomyces sp. 5112.2]SEC17378.1 hypothetical protein SAMN05428944_2789 [Streptomyces sp. 1222.5]
MDEIGQVVVAAGHLALKPRGPRWAHASLCVLDAVFSINAHYERHTAPTCHRYAAWAGISVPLSGSAQLPVPDEQPLQVFVTHIQTYGEEAFSSEVIQNRQRTRANRDAPLKAEAARHYAELLASHGIATLADANALLADPDKLSAIERDLAGVAGHGSGARLAYLWMLLGDDSRIKPDRMVLRWLQTVLQRTVTTVQAISILTEAAARLRCTPWELDHAIWESQRKV